MINLRLSSYGRIGCASACVMDVVNYGRYNIHDCSEFIVLRRVAMRVGAFDWYGDNRAWTLSRTSHSR